jgi:hypothetical protein
MDRSAFRAQLVAQVVALVDLVMDAAEQAPATSVDGIVPVTREAMATEGLDYASILDAAKSGALRTVWQGRRRLTTRAWLCAYVMALPPAVAAVDPTDDLAMAARKRAARNAA